jgi:RNA polymerase-interacting CarD/CdnL/TRCF family regulator
MSLNITTGSYLIDYEQIYVITGIKNQPEVVYYKPYLESDKNKSLICSIPVDNLHRAGLRALLGSKEISSLLADLSKPYSYTPSRFDLKTSKEVFLSNNLVQIIPLLQNLWSATRSEPIKDDKNARSLMELIINHLIDEISFVTKSDSSDISKKITKSLNSSLQ